MRRILRTVPLPWWLLALALSAAVVSATTGALRAAGAARAEWGAHVRVSVVQRAVAAGSTLTAADVALERRPVAMVPPGALGEAPVGRVALVDLVAGEVTIERRLAGPGRTGAAALLRPGERGVAITALTGERPPLTVGDLVDLLAVPADGSRGRLLASGRPVIDVEEETGAVTVAVPATAAVAVAEALERGRVVLALSP